MYQGDDLIFCMGAPGSRWSGSIRALQTCKDINTTDDSEERLYDLTRVRPDDKPLGWHRGCYWGPFHEFGQNFDKLDDMTKEEALAEFKAPFTDWEPGVKIIKSHWFSYHIPLLKKWFPKAKLVAFYMESEDCFTWWHRVGGWDIEYPHYNWYKNDERMRSQIEIENACIQQYFPILKNRTLTECLQELGLSGELHSKEYLFKWDEKIETMAVAMDKDPIEMLDKNIQRIKTGII